MLALAVTLCEFWISFKNVRIVPEPMLHACCHWISRKYCAKMVSRGGSRVNKHLKLTERASECSRQSHCARAKDTKALCRVITTNAKKKNRCDFVLFSTRFRARRWVHHVAPRNFLPPRKCPLRGTSQYKLHLEGFPSPTKNSTSNKLPLWSILARISIDAWKPLAPFVFSWLVWLFLFKQALIHKAERCGLLPISLTCYFSWMCCLDFALVISAKELSSPIDRWFADVISEASFCRIYWPLFRWICLLLELELISDGIRRCLCSG